MKKIRIGLLPRILIAIVLGVVLGNVLTAPWVRVFVTFNSIFGNFLGFLIPLLIVGLVTPAIGDIGRNAGRLLLAIGPEGGWTDEEVALLEEKGFRRYSLGQRILRTDTATIALLAKLNTEDK